MQSHCYSKLFCVTVFLLFLFCLDMPLPAFAKPEVVVSATRTATQSERIGSTVTVITSEDIQKSGAVDILEVLHQVPGFAVNRSGGYGTLSEVRIRGMEANHSLVLVDGIEASDPASDAPFDFGTLNVSDIERIEILRGPQSVLYGSNSIGGVIHVFTKSGRESGKALTGNAHTRYGSHGTYETGATLGGETGKFDWSMSGNYFSTRGISAADEHDGNRESDANRNGSGNLRLGFQATEKLRFDTNLRYVESQTQFDDPFLPSPASDTRQEGTQRDWIGGGAATYSAFDGAWESKLSAQYTQVRREVEDGIRQTDHSKGSRQKYAYLGTVRIADPLTFVFGAESEREEYRSVTDFTLWGTPGVNYDDTVQTYAFYGQVLAEPFKNLFVTLGVRNDHLDAIGNHATYRGTFAYTLPQWGARIRGSFGTGIQAPTPSEFSGYSPYTLPNPDLEPEQSRGWDIGYEQNLFQDRVTLDLTYFDNKIKDKISLEFDSGTFKFINRNIDMARARGVEVGVTFAPIDALQIRGTYTYTRTEDEATKKDLLRRPRHTASANIHYRFLPRTSADLNFTYVGNRFDWGTPAATKMNDYKLIDLRLAHGIGEHWQIFVEGKNLLNEEYQEIRGYGTLGRTFYTGIRFGF